MLDEWIWGEATRISPEAPVPVLRFTGRKTAPGGAANVAMNLLSLGARVEISGAIGDDEAGRDLKATLENAGAKTQFATDFSRPTTLKTRVVAGAQQMVRIDRENDAPSQIRFLPEFAEVSALCLSDYDKGLAASGAFERAIEAAKNAQILVTAGPKPANLARFRGADFVSLNLKEAREASGNSLETDAQIEENGALLRAKFEFGALCITRGGAGVSLFQSGETPQHFAAHRIEVFDVAGAGDTFLSAATLALAAGQSAPIAAQIGNLAAACSVRHVGVVAVSPTEMMELATGEF